MNFSITKFFREGIRWNAVFLGSVIFTIFVIPIFPESFYKTLYDLSFSLIFLLGFINSDRKHPAFLPISVSAVIMLWVSGTLDMPVLFTFSYCVNIIFFGMVIYTLVKHLAGSKTVTPRIILESIITYLLIGLIFSLVISLIDYFDPSAYTMPNHVDASVAVHLCNFIYFTFVTLSTTGFGDIIPLQPYTRSLTILVSITGQMYVAIIIAMLVGKYAATVHQERNEE